LIIRDPRLRHRDGHADIGLSGCAWAWWRRPPNWCAGHRGMAPSGAEPPPTQTQRCCACAMRCYPCWSGRPGWRQGCAGIGCRSAGRAWSAREEAANVRCGIGASGGQRPSPASWRSH